MKARAMLSINKAIGNDDLARVFVGTFEDGASVEFVESIQPPVRRDDKWVLIVSTLKGCPVGCPICDAGETYEGPLSADQIMAQIDHLITSRYPERHVPVRKLKIQFARMGEPAFNDAVLDVLEQLPHRFDAPGLFPCISTVAPAGRERFFQRLLDIKQRLYPKRFQLQFSLHTTDEEARRRLVPARTWTFAEMAAYGRRFRQHGDRKITLNFATPAGYPLEPEVLGRAFSRRDFFIKLTPVNPTSRALASGLAGAIDPTNPAAQKQLQASFENEGFETLVSIGEPDENRIGSNCGMYVSSSKGSREKTRS